MSRSIGFASKGFIAIAGAAVLALTGLGLFAPAAHAAPNDGQTGNKYCTLDTPTGKHAFDAGAEVTIVEPDGHKSTYKCDGNTGKWVKQIKVSPTSLTFDSRFTTLLNSTTLTTTTTTGAGSTIGTSSGFIPGAGVISAATR